MSEPGPSSSSGRLTVLVAVLVAVAVTLVGVGVMVAAGGGGDDDEPAADVEGVEVRDAWTGPNQGVTAVYFTIVNGGQEDQLIGASADVGGTALLMGGDQDADHASADGASSVSLAVPPGTTEVTPGGSHLMLTDLTEALEPGTELTLALTFERADVIEVPVEVLTWEEVADRAG